MRIIAVPELSQVLLCSKGFAVAMVSIQGLTGIVDIGDEELNAARTQALEWKADENRERWLSLLRPQILKALNELAVEADIPARYGFLVKVAEQHGLEVLLDSTLPWVTIRERPGNAILVASAELIRRLSAVPEVLLVYGGNSWKAERYARRLFPTAGDGVLIVPISTDGQPDVGSFDDDAHEIIEGTLEEHFAAGRYERRRRPRDAILLQATMRAVAKSWGKETTGLGGVWRRNKRVLCGRFVRSKPT